MLYCIISVDEYVHFGHDKLVDISLKGIGIFLSSRLGINCEARCRESIRVSMLIGSCRSSMRPDGVLLLWNFYDGILKILSVPPKLHLEVNVELFRVCLCGITQLFVLRGSSKGALKKWEVKNNEKVRMKFSKIGSFTKTVSLRDTYLGIRYVPRLSFIRQSWVVRPSRELIKPR